MLDSLLLAKLSAVLTPETAAIWLLSNGFNEVDLIPQGTFSTAIYSFGERERCVYIPTRRTSDWDTFIPNHFVPLCEDATGKPRLEIVKSLLRAADQMGLVSKIEALEKSLA